MLIEYVTTKTLSCQNCIIHAIQNFLQKINLGFLIFQVFLGSGVKQRKWRREDRATGNYSDKSYMFFFQDHRTLYHNNTTELIMCNQ